MMDESIIGEQLVMDFFSIKFNMEFHLMDWESQKVARRLGQHPPDILCVNRPHVAFEVKEDIRSAQTGNFAFEAQCLLGLRAWGRAHDMTHIYLVYINHYDNRLDIFELGLFGASIDDELERLCDTHPQCRLVPGGDQNHPLFIVPIPIARRMESCLTYKFIKPVEQFLFGRIIGAVLSKSGKNSNS